MSKTQQTHKKLQNNFILCELRVFPLLSLRETVFKDAFHEKNAKLSQSSQRKKTTKSL